MAQNWTDDLPKLFPSWYATVDQQFLQSKDNRRFLKDRLPDFGGTGIDMTHSENGIKYHIPKHEIDQVRFGAKVCALPFFPYREAHLIEDPCMSQLERQKKEFHEFCTRLKRVKSTMNCSNYVKHHKALFYVHKAIKNMRLSGQFDKVEVPENILHMATIFPKNTQLPNVNFGYSGGCLTTLKTNDGSPILLHPLGDKLNKLAVTSLEETYEENSVFKPTSAPSSVKLKSTSHILQIKSSFNGYCHVRQENHCYFVNLTNPSKAHLTEYLKQKKIRNTSPSPFIPVEFFSIHENGRIVLNDLEESKPIWETDHFLFSDKHLSEIPLGCEFGSHPRSLLYFDDKKMYHMDVRLKKQNRSTVFSCYHKSCHRNENLLAMKRLLVNPFQHLVLSNYHLFMCDERYLEKPVLIWNHSLKGSPLYCDITTYETTPNSSDIAILIGTQDTQETALFTVRASQSQIQTVSLSPPLLLSSPSDWTNSLRFHGQHVEETTLKRMSYPLTGICAVPHSNRLAFTAFQINSLGDVFYQDLGKVPEETVERTYRVDMGCVLAPPERILPRVAEWIKVPDTSASVEEEEASDAWAELRKNVDLTDILNSEKEVSNWCNMCKSINVNCDNKLVSKEPCPSCGLHKSQSEELHKGFSEFSLLIDPVSEKPELHTFDNIEAELSQFTDHYSKTMLNVWTALDYNGPATPPWDYPSDYSQFTMSPASNASYSTCTTPNRETATQPDDAHSASELNSQCIFGEETFPMYSQDSFGDYVPPSQVVRPIIGETLRTPKKAKLLSKLNTSNAGF